MHLALGRRRQPEIGVEDGLLDRMDHRPVPDLDAEQPRLGHADGGELIERHVGAVGLHLNLLQQADEARPVRRPPSSCLSEAIAPCMRRLMSLMSYVAVAMVPSCDPIGRLHRLSATVSRPW